MKITLKKLTLRNFKGQESVEVVFNQVTNIIGDNGSGKTTLVDAFLWLLFDKNSKDESQFDIKNTVKKELNKLNHEVVGVFMLDESELALKKVFSEKWTKRRGEAETVFDGNTTEYFWNYVPVNQSEYKKRISEIINEQVFKLVTSPLYFNSLKWTEKRSILMNIAGGISNDELATTQDFKTLIQNLSKYSTSNPIDDYRKELAAKRRKIKEQLDLIPARIDEVKRGLPTEEPDYDAVLLEIGKINREIGELDNQIADISKANETENNKKISTQNDLHKAKMRLSELELEAKQKANEQNRSNSLVEQVSEKQRKLNSLATNNQNISKRIEELDSFIIQLTEDNKKLRAKYSEEDAKTFTFDSISTLCPSCGQNLPQNKIIEAQEKFTQNFIEEKKIVLNNIKGQGIDNNGKISRANEEKSKLTTEFETNSKEIGVLSSEIEMIGLTTRVEVSFESFLTQEHKDLTLQAYRLTEQLNNTTNLIDSSKLVAERSAKNSLLPDLKAKLLVKESVQKSKDRIVELENSERTMAQEMADIEKLEFVAQEFVKKKMSMVEDRVNSMFSMVKFRMFDVQVNGQEVECCDCMVNGTPWATLNDGHRVRAGIDIINRLSLFYNFYAPIWIDNRESTTSIPETTSQVINLSVVANKPLNIE